MMIESIMIENYRQYRGRHEIRLGLDQNKNINVIRGPNGSGKSNIMNAITWCLYGIEAHLDKYEGSKQSILNDAILNELDENSIGDVCVEISLVDESARRTKFQRSARIRRTSNQYQIDGISFKGFVELNKRWTEISEPNFLRDRFLPQSIHSFFFFDGERLDEFFKMRASQVVRNAIDEVSQLSMLESAITRLGQTIRKIRSRVKKILPESDSIQAQIEAIEGGLSAVQEDIDNTGLRIAAVDVERASHAATLKGVSDEVVRRLEAIRESLKQSIEKATLKLESATRKRNQLVIESGPFILLSSELEKSLGLIEERTIKGELPPNIKRKFVEELLERGVCICKTDIREGPARVEIEKLLQISMISELSQDLIDMRYAVESALSCQRQFGQESETLSQQINGFADEIQVNESQVREIDTQLQSVDKEAVADAAFKMAQLEEEKLRLERHLAIVEQQMFNGRLRIESLERKMRQALREADKRGLEVERLEVASDMLEVLQKVYENLLQKNREQVEHQTKQYFMKLIWKKETYKDVLISEEYHISVMNSFEQDCLGSLSAGEREVLALSFLAALREISGFSAPIIMDTPLARISKEPKENIAQLLPKFFRGAQVTLLVTEEEYTPVVRTHLAPSVDKEYSLLYNEAEHSTKVVDSVK